MNIRTPKFFAVACFLIYLLGWVMGSTTVYFLVAQLSWESVAFTRQVSLVRIQQRLPNLSANVYADRTLQSRLNTRYKTEPHWGAKRTRQVSPKSSAQTGVLTTAACEIATNHVNQYVAKVQERWQRACSKLLRQASTLVLEIKNTQNFVRGVTLTGFNLALCVCNSVRQSRWLPTTRSQVRILSDAPNYR